MWALLTNVGMDEVTTMWAWMRWLQCGHGCGGYNVGMDEVTTMWAWMR